MNTPNSTPGVTKLQSLVTGLDTELNNVYAQYLALHDGFNSYRGLALDEISVESVNSLILQIHEKYRELYAVLSWLHTRSTFAANVAKGFDDWVLDLEKAGARRHGESDEKIIIN